MAVIVCERDERRIRCNSETNGYSPDERSAQGVFLRLFSVPPKYFSEVIFMQKHRIQYMAKVAILGALAGVIMLLECPLPFAPPFYQLNFSEIATLISGFALGPVAGVLAELIKILVNLIFTGTKTMFVGELSSFIMGVSFVLPAAMLYKHKKCFKTAVIGMVLGSVSLALVGALMNYFVIIPAYVKFMGLEMDAIIAMGTAVNGNINGLETLILFATVPFNLVKGVGCSFLTALVYKRVSPILHKNFGKKQKKA